MVEGEALKKWCPFARVSVQLTSLSGELRNVPTSHNRNPIKHGENFSAPLAAFCIGSACMAWRRQSTSPLFNVTKDGKTSTFYWDPTGFDGYKDAVIVKMETHEGYCGLAGKP